MYFLFAAYGCLEEKISYELEMHVILDGEGCVANQNDPIFEADIGTAPFQRGCFCVKTSFSLMRIQGDSKVQIKEWYPLVP